MNPKLKFFSVRYTWPEKGVKNSGHSVAMGFDQQDAERRFQGENPQVKVEIRKQTGLRELH